jgi:HK97 gp10 family phage protein
MSIKVQGINDAIKALKKYEAEVVRDTAKEMNKAMLMTQTEAKLNAPVNFGRLRSSIVTTKAKPTDLVASTVVNVNYAPYVEFGTKSKVKVPQGLERYALDFQGKGGSFDSLLNSIEDWVKKKGIPSEAAYPIALNIAREGVSARPFLFPAWEKERPKFEQALKELLQR